MSSVAIYCPHNHIKNIFNVTIAHNVLNEVDDSTVHPNCRTNTFNLLGRQHARWVRLSRRPDAAWHDWLTGRTGSSTLQGNSWTTVGSCGVAVPRDSSPCRRWTYPDDQGTRL